MSYGSRTSLKQYRPYSNSRHRWAVIFSRVHNPSIKDFTAVVHSCYGGDIVSFLASSHWPSMAAAVSRRLRYSHSRNFYRDLGNFSKAAVHKTEFRRKNIFSGEYFVVEGHSQKSRTRLGRASFDALNRIKWTVNHFYFLSIMWLVRLVNRVKHSFISKWRLVRGKKEDFMPL